MGGTPALTQAVPQPKARGCALAPDLGDAATEGAGLAAGNDGTTPQPSIAVVAGIWGFSRPISVVKRAQACLLSGLGSARRRGAPWPLHRNASGRVEIGGWSVARVRRRATGGATASCRPRPSAPAIRPRAQGRRYTGRAGPRGRRRPAAGRPRARHDHRGNDRRRTGRPQSGPFEAATPEPHRSGGMQSLPKRRPHGMGGSARARKRTGAGTRRGTKHRTFCVRARNGGCGMGGSSRLGAGCAEADSSPPSRAGCDDKVHCHLTTPRGEDDTRIHVRTEGLGWRWWRAWACSPPRGAGTGPAPPQAAWTLLVNEVAPGRATKVWRRRAAARCPCPPVPGTVRGTTTRDRGRPLVKTKTFVLVPSV